MQPLADTPPTPRADLEHALSGGLALVGHLLTRGEAMVIRAWFNRSTAARALYARLLGRRDRMVSTERLDGAYAEVPDAAAACSELAHTGFAWTTQRALPVRWILPLYDRDELGHVCKALKVGHRGRRSTLEARLVEAGTRALPHLQRPGIRLRHRSLVRRLCGAYLGRPDGDLSALVLQRMGTIRFPDYTPTGGSGPFPDRRTMVAFERARHRAHRVLSEERVPEDEVAHALELLARRVSTPPELRRFRAARYGARVARVAAAHLERAGETAAAATIWDALVAPDLPDSAAAVRRWALCRDKLGDPAAGAHRCDEARSRVPAADRLALERTGRRLARKARTAWRPARPLHAPTSRRLTLPPPDTTGARPKWQGQVVETAVAETIRATGRTVVEGENLLWTTLFGMLLRDVLFAPVAGMLPGRLQMAPLDLGLAAFAQRRRRSLDQALSEIRSDAGAARLTRAFAEHAGEAIRGVAWNRWTEHQLQTVVAGLGGELLASILGSLARGASRSGLPDLWILHGPAVRVPDLFPGRLPARPVAIEVKGPGDSLRDHQRVWLDRLHGLDLSAEVWEVRSAAR